MWARLVALVVFCVCFGVVFWFALVHTVHLGNLAVPELRGLSGDQAEQVAHDLGLTLKVEDPVFSDRYAAGSVARQEPFPGYHVKTGSVVEVRMSMGGERVVVPDVRGESMQSASDVLRRDSLRPGRCVKVMREDGADRVLASDPQIGAEVAPSRDVALLVNQSPAQELWVMPSLLSQSIAGVRSFCSRNRFKLGQVHEVDYPGVAHGLVLRQYPPAGSPVGRSDIITVWVSQ